MIAQLYTKSVSGRESHEPFKREKDEQEQDEVKETLQQPIIREIGKLNRYIYTKDL